MDFRNQAIAIDKLNQFEVNKSIQRSTAKAIAMHGLGLQLWTGEDLPEVETSVPTPEPAKAKPSTALIDLVVDDENWKGVVKYAKDNKESGFEKIGQQLRRKYNLSDEVKQAIVDLLK